MKSLTIPSVRTDFDYIVITGAIIYNAKIDPKSALANEDVLPQWLLQVVVNEKKKRCTMGKRHCSSLPLSRIQRLHGKK